MNTSSNSEDKIWWFRKNGKKYGPMTQAELKANVVEGDVSWQDLAWCTGASEWKPIASLNIFSAVSYGASEPPPGRRWAGERNDTSLLFCPTNIVSGEIDRRPRVSSGVLDMRSLRAAYEAEKAAQPKSPAPVFAGEAFDASASFLLPHRAAPKKPSRLVYGLAGVAVALTMTSAALAAVAFGKTPGEPLVSGAVTHALLATADVARDVTPAPQPPAPDVVTPDVVTPDVVTPDVGPAVEPVTTTSPVAEPAKKHPRKTVSPKVTKTVRRTTKTTKTTKTATAKWDEYACLLATDPPPACNVYSGAKTTPKEPEVVAPDPHLPTRVSTAQISTAMRKLDYRVERCADLLPGAGLVKVKVKVSPSGTVTGVSATSSPDPKLSSCITRAVKKASFPNTQNGASFAWAFPLR